MCGFVQSTCLTTPVTVFSAFRSKTGAAAWWDHARVAAPQISAVTNSARPLARAIELIALLLLRRKGEVHTGFPLSVEEVAIVFFADVLPNRPVPMSRQRPCRRPRPRQCLWIDHAGFDRHRVRPCGVEPLDDADLVALRRIPRQRGQRRKPARRDDGRGTLQKRDR